MALCSEPARPDGGVSPAWIALLADSELEQESSPAILGRGRTCAASGAVQVLVDERGTRPEIRAQVQGTALYSTTLAIEDETLTGDCDCPNARDGWFCKHQVALAIVWRHRLKGEEPPIDDAVREAVAATARRTRAIEDDRKALAAFLGAQPAAALADKLVEWADRDADIERELQLWRKVAQAPRSAEVKPLITKLMSPGRGVLDWRDTAAYARRAEAVLTVLAELRARDARAAADASLHALRRGWSVLERADDSSGDVSGLCRAIGDAWVAALQACGPQPATFGITYLQVRLDDPFESFDAAAADAAIGEAALARYRQLLAERWRTAREAANAATAAREKRDAASRCRSGTQPRLEIPFLSGEDVQLMTLERLHLEQLEAAGDFDAALAVLRSELSRPHRHAQVTRFLEAHGRMREAFASAEQACKAFPDDWRLQDDLLRCYERDGWTAEALALRRRQFEQQPSLAHYQAVLRAAASAGVDVDAMRAELLAWITARETGGLVRPLPDVSSRSGLRRPPPRTEPDVTLRAEILCAEKRWAEALGLVQPPARCAPGLLRALALRLGPEQAEDSVALLLRVFGAAMNGATSPYRDVLELVGEIAARLPPGRRAEWLAQLAATYKAKRNFVQGLPRA